MTIIWAANLCTCSGHAPLSTGTPRVSRRADATLRLNNSFAHSVLPDLGSSFVREKQGGGTQARKLRGSFSVSKPETAPAPKSVPQLEARVLTGVRWVAVGQVATQTGRFAVSIVLAHLLAPSEFGLMAMAAAITTIASLFPTLGTGQAIVQRKELSEPLLRTVATLGLLTGLLLSGLLVVAAWTLATKLFAEPRLAAVVSVLAAQFIIQAVGVVPESLLQREMRLGRLVTIDVAHLVASSIVAVGLALNGWGVWAMVVGILVGALVRTAAVLMLSPWQLRFGFDRGELRSVASFSASVLGTNIVTYVSRFADRVAIGRLLGVTSLGFYDYACRLYWYPFEVLSPILVRVMFPAFSKIQDDNAILGRAFLRSNGLIAFVACPIMLGLAAVADPFVPVVLGEQWRPIVPLVEVLAPAGMLAAIGVTTGELFYAKGRATLRFWWASANAAITIAAVIVGVSGGILGVAIALACVRVPITIAGFSVALRLTGLSLVDLWRTVRVTFILSLLMGAAVLTLRLTLLQTSLLPALVLLICVTFGATIFVVGARIYRPQALDDFYRLLPAPVQRRPFVAWLFEGARRPA